MKSNNALVVDIDGSLLASDLLMECFWAALGKDFIATLRAIGEFIWKPAKLKRRLYEISELDINLQPVRQEVLDYVNKALSQGRLVLLASGSDQHLIDALAQRLNIPGEHAGSDGELNFTGTRKAGALVETFGEDGFDYIGNATPDLKVWRHAANIIVVAPSGRLLSKVDALGKRVDILDQAWDSSDLLRGIRPKQWIKNALLILPLLASHSFQLQSIFPLVLAIISFCLAASAIYIVNDLLDLEADRLHPRKNGRPFASGAVPIDIAMYSSIGLGLTSLLLGWIVGWGFLAILVLYIFTSLAYSLFLKRMRWIDVFVLSSLYTLRVLAGSVAIAAGLSGWLVTFIFAAFLALGCVKRLTELARYTSNERLPGRGYAKSDMEDLRNISGAGVFSALSIFLAYSFSPTATELYPNLWMLRLAVFPIGFWLIRMVYLGYAGKQNYDPIEFAIRDKVGLGVLAVAALLLAVASI